MVAFVSVTVFEIVFVAVNCFPAFLIVRRAVEISVAENTFFPNARNKLTCFFKIKEHNANLIVACLCRHCVGMEIIPVFTNHMPARNKLTELCIAVSRSFFVKENACVLGLTLIDTVFAKVIIIAVNRFNACILNAVCIVSKAAVFIYPAFLDCL